MKREISKQARALRLAAKFLRLQWMGHKTSPDESKMISDVCFLALPMKYRLSKAEMELMQREVGDGRGREIADVRNGTIAERE